MSLAGWAAAATVGLLAGGLSGLIGIGGGAVMVPFLYFLLARPQIFGVHIPLEDQAVVAHATSLAAIVPISLRGVWLYHRAGLVEWRVATRLGLASAVAAVAGARLAIDLPGQLLKALFGLFLLISALRLVLPGRDDASTREADGSPGLGLRAVMGGFAVGLVSSLLGVGGGLVAIPILIHMLHLPIRKVSGTSLAIVVFTATAGVLSYGASGWMGGFADRGALTYIELPTGIALTLGALVAVPVGTSIHQRLPTRSLRWLFAGLFLLLGGRIAIVNLLHVLRR